MDSQRIIEQLSDSNPDAVFFDNMNAALIGIGYRAHLEPVAVYSKSAIYEKLFADGLSKEDADEYFNGRFTSVWADEHTPVIIDDLQGE